MKTPAPFSNLTRFALTHVNADGLRILTRRNIGPSHFDTESDAQTYLLHFREHNTDASLASIFGPNACSSFAVRPVQCHAHGDAFGSVLAMEARDSAGHWTPAHFCPACSRIHIIPRSRAEHTAFHCSAPLPALLPGSDELPPTTESAANPHWRELWQERDDLSARVADLERERDNLRSALKSLTSCVSMPGPHGINCLCVSIDRLEAARATIADV